MARAGAARRWTGSSRRPGSGERRAGGSSARQRSGESCRTPGRRRPERGWRRARRSRSGGRHVWVSWRREPYALAQRDPSEPRELDAQMDAQPSLAVLEVEPGDLADPAQAVVQPGAMEDEAPGRGLRVAGEI